jgi:hypothetical protein
MTMHDIRDPLERLSAWIDGEPVDPSSLAEALAHPEARDVLRDFVALRAAVQRQEHDGDAPSRETAARIRDRLADAGRTTWWRRKVAVPAPLLAASLLVVVALVVWGSLELAAPPEIVPVDQPPPPDRVIRFEPGVDWHELDGQEDRT